MTEPKPKPDPHPADAHKEGGVVQPKEKPAAETGMVGEGESDLGRGPPANERPGGMIGEG